MFSIICLNNDPYDGLRRPRHILMEKLAEMGHSVVFGSTATRSFSERFGREQLRWGGLKRVAPRFFWWQPFVFFKRFTSPRMDRLSRAARVALLELVSRALLRQRRVVFVTVPDEDYLRFCARARRRQDFIIYNVHDRYLDAADQWIPEHFSMLALADLVLCTSDYLLDEVSQHRNCRKPPRLLDHGVDSIFLDFPLLSVEPGVFNSNSTHLGCTGSFGEQIDWPLVLGLLHFGHRVTFVGKIDRRFAADPNVEKIMAHSGFRLIGPTPHCQMPEIISTFDVGILPYANTEYVKGINPLKVKEFLALGKRVIGTPLASLDQFGEYVIQARTAADWHAALAAMNWSEEQKQAPARRAAVASSTYDHRARYLHSLIDECMAAGGAERSVP